MGLTQLTQSTALIPPTKQPLRHYKVFQAADDRQLVSLAISKKGGGLGNTNLPSWDKSTNMIGSCLAPLLTPLTYVSPTLTVLLFAICYIHYTP